MTRMSLISLCFNLLTCARIISLDTERYDQVWQLNEEQCVALAKRVLQADKAMRSDTEYYYHLMQSQVIYEQQLGLQWMPPSPAAFDSHMQATSADGTTSAMELAQKVLDGGFQKH